MLLLLLTSGLPPPTIVSNQDEFVLQPNSLFNISCTGKRNVIWAEPLPNNALVFPGYYTSTLFIDNTTVENTGYYTCVYENQDGNLDGDLENSETDIYIFVPDSHAPFVPEPSNNLVISGSILGITIPCRVSHPDSYVILKRVPSGEEMHALYDSKDGFSYVNNLSSGQYQCETTILASEVTVRAGQPFNITCIVPAGSDFQQQWLHLKKQARCNNSPLCVFPF
uniref:Immunoglobulin-like beta-sandwich domain-containing protein n=1 Tax=Amphilophus citrinellus TaxID=61819 RepID=A0A3Q0T8A7_AMPCI